MKLNYKRTVLVGMAFFLITAFWQAYDAIIPLILTNHFGLSQTSSGAIMSLDNVLAVFMLPLFGSISDKVNTKYGRRTPFIIIGSIAAVITFIVLTVIDNYQIAALISNEIPSTVQGSMTDVEYNTHLAQLTLELTKQNPLPLIGFIATLLVLLIAMATFRSPAVALMPDVTVKPLRSKGNAVINLLGAIGGIIILALGIVFGTSKNLYMQYTPYVIAVCAVMLVGLIVFIIGVKEKKWAAEASMQAKILDTDTSENTESAQTAKGGGKLSPAMFRSLLLILASVALWYVGYNSITSKYSVYATNVLGFDFNLTLMLAQGAAIASYIPVGYISSKFGRKKMILAGVLMLGVAFLLGHFVNTETPEVVMYPIFALAGIGWATINVNSFPMVVELASEGNVGKYTGYYYTASMTAQIVAPILSGKLYDIFGINNVFFPFGAVFVALSFVTMLFVKHGDSKPTEKKSVLEHLDVGD